MSQQDMVFETCAGIIKQEGWTCCENSAVAWKDFESAVGLKRAFIYFYPSDGFNFSLKGGYQSEGRNILYFGCLIPESASEATIKSITEAWLEKVNTAIDQSYAVRLLSNRRKALQATP
jgi:hypothetical protein